MDQGLSEYQEFGGSQDDKDMFHSRAKCGEIKLIPEPTSLRPSPLTSQNQFLPPPQHTLSIYLPCSHKSRPEHSQISPSECARKNMQKNATQMLMQQSELNHQMNDIRLEQIRSLSSELVTHAIEGFYQGRQGKNRIKRQKQSKEQERYQKGRRNREIIQQGINNAWNHRKTHKVIKNQIKFKPHVEPPQYKRQLTPQKIKPVLLKATIFKRERFNSQKIQMLNNQFVSLQEKFKKINEKHRIRLVAASKRLRTEHSPNFKIESPNTKNCHLGVSKLSLPLSESKLVRKDEDITYPNLQSLIKNKYFYSTNSRSRRRRTQSTGTIDHPTLKNQSSSSSKLNLDQGHSNSQSTYIGLAEVKQKLSNIYHKIKQANQKEMQVRNYKDSKRSTLHRLHKQEGRLQGVMSYAFLKQRSKMKNHSMKSQTVDLCQLSKKSKEREGVSKLLQAKNMKLERSRSKEEKTGEVKEVGHMPAITPIFITEK